MGTLAACPNVMNLKQAVALSLRIFLGGATGCVGSVAGNAAPLLEEW